MKKLTYILISTLVFVLFSTASAQTPSVFWIKSFSPGSANLNDPQVDQAALAMLDELMRDKQIEVTFLGAADSKSWKMKGEYVHEDISEAWNDAKSLGRARALRARYGRGNVGVTHENIAGVKVVWTKSESHITKLDQLERENKSLKQDIEDVKNNLIGIQSELGRPAVEERNFDWSLYAGFWTWQSGSNGSIVSPALASSVTIGKTSFQIQGGVTPWHTSSPNGNKSESFVYAGAKHMKTEVYGFTLGAYRGWEFYTATDDWSFKTTGVSAGFVMNHKFVEFNPALTYSNLSSLDKDSEWRLGVSLGVNLNIKSMFNKN